MTQAEFKFRRGNPDVLTSIANLSNDEVFTPPEFANKMLDTLEEAWAASNNGANIWEDSTVTFLDPFTKSGVFLREITERLTHGLEKQIPDLQERVNHILTKQVFGIAITQLTSLLARRSVYCSKGANGEHSIVTAFDNPDGNIWFERTEHTWVGGKDKVIVVDENGDEVTKTTDGRCKYCGASQKDYDRDKTAETHAYSFIHTENIANLILETFGAAMKFDVIIGNPPYQLSDGGGAGTSASPIYQKFIQQGQRLDPRFLTMVVPARWYSGGKGLDDFRSEMLADKRIRFLADFPDSRIAFDGVDVAGGVCYFLWDRDNRGDCEVQTITSAEIITAKRDLNEYPTFIRDNRAISIIHKVLSSGEKSFSSLVSSRKPFGIESAQKSNIHGNLYLFASGGDGKINTGDVPKGHELIDTWRVLLSKTSSEHAGQTDKTGKKRLLSRIEIMPPGSVSTESYLVIGPLSSENEANIVSKYLRTKFVRFLISTILLTQNISKGMFEFVPLQSFDHEWTDSKLYSKYNLSTKEIELIDNSIKPIEVVDE